MRSTRRPLVEILYFDGCPNHEPALATVERVDRELGTNADVRLVNVPDHATAERVRFLGSPTVRVDGVDVDYENLPAAERAAFTTFARDLQADLRARGLRLSITVQPKSGDASSRGPGAMEWPALCGFVDRLQVMMYNEHNASTEPGPIASLDWMAGVVNYGLRSCPAAKFVPVLKVSGMDWGPNAADWRSFNEVASLLAAQRLKPRREWHNRVPWFVYKPSGGRHVVYYEDARSLVAKAERLRDRGLTTIVLWSLGSEDPEAIARLAAAMGIAGAQNR